MSSGETTVIVEESARRSGVPRDRAVATISAAEALASAEVERTRGFVRLIWLFIVAMLASLPVFGGNATLELVIAIGLGVGLLSGIAFYFRIRDARHYSYRAMMLISLSAIVNAQIVVVYFGVFSAAVMLLVVGIYFVSRSEDARGAFIFYAVTAVLQAGCAAVLMSGYVDDPGMMTPSGLSQIELILAQTFVQAVLFATYRISRATRATTARAMYDLQAAMRVAAQRGALLDEAQADLDRALQVGEPGPFSNRVLGEYHLGVVIGRGAMGDVYAATHADTGHLAAVKLLPTSVLGDPRFVDRFMREARAASALESPNVVRVLGASDPDEPLPYMVMERLEGYDLAQALRRSTRLELEVVCEMVRQIGSVVDLAKEKGIVHRDLKPQNIYCTQGGGGEDVWKLLDFGVAALVDQSGSLTQGHAVGTPSYMSPEQARSLPVDHRADLYALAAIAYRCITGRPAFAARDIPALLYDVVHKMPDQPSELADVPDDVDAVLAIGLAKKREDRFDSGAELADALEAASSGDLGDEMRARAAELIAEFPWGVRR